MRTVGTHDVHMYSIVRFCERKTRFYMITSLSRTPALSLLAVLASLQLGLALGDGPH